MDREAQSSATEETKRARACLRAYMGRLHRGMNRLVGLLFVAWAASQCVWLSYVVAGVGWSDAYQKGAVGAVFWSIVKFAVAAGLVWIGSRPALRIVYGELIENGVVVPCRITQGPDFVLARLFGGALDLALLDMLLGRLVPARLVSFELHLDGNRSVRQVGAMYPDEIPRELDEGFQALVVADRPDKFSWLVREKRGAREGTQRRR